MLTKSETQPKYNMDMNIIFMQGGINVKQTAFISVRYITDISEKCNFITTLCHI